MGECGLDFFYDHAPRDVQAEVLREQCRVAVATGLPAVVHNRESDDAMLEIVREPEFAALRADFHSFAGEPEMLDELSTRGHYFGFSGMVTFAKADNIRDVAGEGPGRSDSGRDRHALPGAGPASREAQPDRLGGAGR